MPLFTFEILLVATASLSGALFGYDTGVVSGAVLLMADDWDLSPLEQEIVVSSAVLFAAIGAILCGIKWFEDLGRKNLILYSCLAFAGGSIIMGIAPNLPIMVLGRCIVGIAIGVASHTGPMYISEAAPAEKRGALISGLNVMVVAGQVLAAVVDGSLSEVPGGWRYMLAIGAVPAVIQGVGFLFMPESPRFLAMVGKYDDVLQVLTSIRMAEDDPSRVHDELKDIHYGLVAEGSVHPDAHEVCRQSPHPVVRSLCAANSRKRAPHRDRGNSEDSLTRAQPHTPLWNHRDVLERGRSSGDGDRGGVDGPGEEGGVGEVDEVVLNPVHEDKAGVNGPLSPPSVSMSRPQQHRQIDRVRFSSPDTTMPGGKHAHQSPPTPGLDRKKGPDSSGGAEGVVMDTRERDGVLVRIRRPSSALTNKGKGNKGNGSATAKAGYHIVNKGDTDGDGDEGGVGGGASSTDLGGDIPPPPPSYPPPDLSQSERMEFEGGSGSGADASSSGGGGGSLVYLVRHSAVFRRQLLLGVGLWVLSQFGGINTIMYYGATILTFTGFGNESTAIWLSAACDVAQVVGVGFGLYYMDSWGRRPMVLLSCAGAAVSLGMLGLSLLIGNPGGGDNGNSDNGGGDGDGGGLGLWSMVSALSLASYLLCFGAGLSSTPYVVNGEIYPLKIRAQAIGTTTAVFWFSNFLVSVTFLSYARAASLPVAFWTYGGVCVVGWFWLFFSMPETAGVALEDMEKLFDGNDPRRFVKGGISSGDSNSGSAGASGGSGGGIGAINGSGGNANDVSLSVNGGGGLGAKGGAIVAPVTSSLV